jgi:DNA-binding Lrp family transcriptional regulator
MERMIVAKLDDDVVSLLKDSPPLTLAEIAEKLGKPEKAVFRALRRLFEKEILECVNRKYVLTKK